MSENDPPDIPAAISRSQDRLPVDPERDAQFERFYRDNITKLVAFLVLQGWRLVDAADVAQDTMIKAYHKWRDITHHRAWVYPVASRELIRRQLRDRETLVDELSLARTPLLVAGDVEGWELRHDIIDAMASLSPRQRQVLDYSLFEYTPAEIAAELGMTSGAVREALSQARRAVGIRLSRRGVGR